MLILFENLQRLWRNRSHGAAAHLNFQILTVGLISIPGDLSWVRSKSGI